MGVQVRGVPYLAAATGPARAPIKRGQPAQGAHHGTIAGPAQGSARQAVPITLGPQDVVVVVAGGAGTLSMVACTWSHSRSVTRAVERYCAAGLPSST